MPEILHETGKVLKLSRNILPVKVGTLTVNAVLDTGAASSFIIDTFLKKIKVVFPTLASCPVTQEKTFLDASSNDIDLQEVVEFELEVPDCFLPVKCYVSPKLPVPLILGWDWLKHNDVVIMSSFETAAVYGQPVLSIMEELDEPEPLGLRLVNGIEIPPTAMVQ